MERQALFNGVPFWSGSVNLHDGEIEEVHSYQQAQAADCHHTFLFFAGADRKDGGRRLRFFLDQQGRRHRGRVAGNAWRQPYAADFRANYLSGKNQSEQEE